MEYIHSTWIPWNVFISCGICTFHMESMWNPHICQMECTYSTWIPYGIRGDSKVLERLHILNLPRVGPVLDDLNLVRSHKQSFGSENVAQILHPIFMKFVFLRFRLQTMLLQVSEDLLDLLAMSSSVGRINEDVVQIDNNTKV